MHHGHGSECPKLVGEDVFRYRIRMYWYDLVIRLQSSGEVFDDEVFLRTVSWPQSP